MIGSIVYNEDCITGMKRLSDKFFDLAIVDPPYGIGLDMIYKNGINRNIHEAKQWNIIIPGVEYFNELYRISKEQIIWGANYFMQFINTPGMIIHDKMMGTEGTRINFSEADIASCSLQKRVTFFRYQWAGNAQNATINWKNTGIDKRIHPTQKPIALYRWCLHKYAKLGWKILDTHLGSGSSRIAAWQMGFDFTGFEIDKDYFDMANARFEEFKNHSLEKTKGVMKQKSLFPDEKPDKEIKEKKSGHRSLHYQFASQLHSQGFYEFAKSCDTALQAPSDYIINTYKVQDQVELKGIMESVFGDAWAYQETIYSYLDKVKNIPGYGMAPIEKVKK